MDRPVSIALSTDGFAEEPHTVEVPLNDIRFPGIDFTQEDEELLDLTGCTTGAPVSSNDASPKFPQQVGNSVRLRHWQELWAIIMTSGSRKMTKHHYQ